MTAMRRAIVIALAGLAIGVNPSGAAAHSVSRDSSETFVRSAIRLDRALLVHHALQRASAEALANSIASRCPGAFASYPSAPTQAQRSIHNRLSLALTMAIYRADLEAARASYTTFVREIGPLGWRSRPVGERVNAYRANVVALFALSPPDLCADLRRSAGVGFTSVPSATAQFIESVPRELRDGPEDLARIATAMKPFLTPDDLPGLRRLNRLEAAVNSVFNADTNAVEARLGRELGTPLP
jgi:hypothetical protein